MVSLAKAGRAPKFFAKTTKNGTPANALIFSNLLGLVSMLNYTAGPGKVFSYLTSISGSATYIAWAVIGVTHIRFRKGWIAQGNRVEDLPFRALWYPYGTIFVIFINTLLVFIAGYSVFIGDFDAVGFVINYIVIAVFVLLFCGWKILKRTKIVSLSEMDLTTGRRQVSVTLQHDDVEKEKAQIPWYVKMKRLIFS